MIMSKKNSKTALALLLATAMMLSAAGCAGIPVAVDELPETENSTVETEEPDVPAAEEAVEPEAEVEAELTEDEIQTGVIEPQTLLAGGAIEVTPLSTSVTVPSNVTPVKSWSVTVGTTYKIPDDQKQTGDTYASSNTAIVTVNATTGQFTPQSAGVAYIVATNGGQSRYFKVTASAAGATTTAAATNVFDGYTVTVLDTTTPATSVWIIGNSTDYTFLSVDNKALGSISEDAYMAIMAKYNTNTTGSGPNLPPDGYGGDWQVWFAEQFNVYRGLSDGAGSAAVAESDAAKIAEYRQEIVRLVNLEREKVGLTPYIVSDVCMEYSQIRVQELAALYSHTRPDGTDAGYEVIGAGQATPEEIVNAWMNSPAHKAALLNENRTYVGAGVRISSGQSIYWEMYFEYDPDHWAGTLLFG